MGDANFRPPTESTPLDRSPKNLAQVITSAAPMAAPNLVQIRRWGASGQMGFVDISPHFRGVNRRFQAKRAKYCFMLSKLQHRFQPNFAKR